MSKFRRYIKELKSMELAKILKSIGSKSTKPSGINYIHIEKSDEVRRDYLLLSKSRTCDIIKEILDNELTVVCNLTDRDGKVGLKISEVYDDIQFEYSTLLLKDGSRHNLYDRFLYNIKYVNKKDHFSLEEHDEYFEKLTVKNED